jgi:hypothetical protein
MLRYKVRTLEEVPEAARQFYKAGSDGWFRLQAQGYYEMELAMKKERELRRKAESHLRAVRRNVLCRSTTPG